jgi:hypothetical protein
MELAAFIFRIQAAHFSWTTLSLKKEMAIFSAVSVNIYKSKCPLYLRRRYMHRLRIENLKSLAT